MFTPRESPTDFLINFMHLLYRESDHCQEGIKQANESEGCKKITKKSRMKGRKRLIKKKRCTSHLKRQYSKLMLARFKGPFHEIFDAFLSSRNEKVRETVHLGSRSNILSKNKCSKISLHCLFKRLTFCIRISK